MKTNEKSALDSFSANTCSKDSGTGRIFFLTLLVFGAWVELVWGVAMTPLWSLGTPFPRTSGGMGGTI